MPSKTRPGFSNHKGLMVKSPQKCLIFDLDDTLIHSARAYDSALAELGLSRKNADYLAGREKVKNRLPTAHVAGRNRLLYFKAMLEGQGKFSASATLALMERYERSLAREFAVLWTPDREKLVRELGKTYRLILATNENCRTQLIKIEAIDPKGDLFSRVLISEEFGEEKPSPRIFREVLAAAQCPPEHCLFIGDSQSADIVGAKSHGIKACRSREFRQDDKPPENPAMKPDFIINSLIELPPLLASVWP